ncbi:transcription antitermination factor NusB [Athalassotoga saccharophila]|uniref:transcription antitermination factor NusB n=1 Tax=Athalassotoga saccharophila TaxID=1441386 RepID=UPI00137AEAE1|nr:transcription antitermination factor NusB [Athalassotoga saccharophila]BBJ28865.1 16S rRNA (cytosine(967)-C(5))-methyltransferase [Athalassotoga saccharophila]
MNSRIVALEILKEGISNFFISRTSWEKTVKFKDEDRAFIRKIVYGTLRYYFELNKQIDLFLKNPKNTPPYIKSILIMGAYELIEMKTPSYAVVNEYTKISPPKFKGLVNAILRRISEVANEIDLGTGLPQWLYDKLESQFGENFDMFLKSIESHEISLRSVNKSQDEIIGDFISHGIQAYPMHFSPWGIKCPEGIDLNTFKQFENGDFTFQDESSQLVGIVVNPKKGEKILDAFGGVGTKTTHLIQMEPESSIFYNDLSRSKSSIAMDNFKRLRKMPSKIMSLDILNDEIDEKFDKILVDAPCTALGTIGKHPDLLLRITERDIEEKSEMQLKMIDKLWNNLSIGGTLVYSVCTVTKEETDGVIEKFLSTHKGRSVDPFDGVFDFDFNGFGVQLLKWMEGFYISKIIKEG